MNDIIIDQKDERIEPFTSVAELCAEFGYQVVIESLSALLAFDVKEDACCVTCQRKAVFWHEQLYQALGRYQREFPAGGVAGRINSRGATGIVQ
jgi:hypothetical protein